jgi:hypothetical protein
MNTGRARNTHCFSIFGLSLTLLLFHYGSSCAKTEIRLSGWDKAVLDSLDHPSADPERRFAVRRGASWNTELGLWRFGAGTLTFLRNVGGRPTGCYFAGEGFLEYTPPIPIERGQLRRFCGDSALSASFSKAYFRFFDSVTANALLTCADTAVTDGKSPADGILRNWENDANNDLAIRLAVQGWRMLLRDEFPESFLYISADIKDQRKLHFVQDDAEEEAIGVLRKPRSTLQKGAVDQVCSYDRRRDDAEAETRAGLVHGGFRVLDYTSDVFIKPSANVVIDVSLRVSPFRDRLGEMAFTLAPKLEIDSVQVNGVTAPFVYDGDGGWIALRCPMPLEKGDTAAVRFFYRGDHLMYKFAWGDFFISYTTTWLPVGRPRERTHYFTTFKFPKHYDLVSSGELVFDTASDGYRTKRWRTYDPSSFISFNYGAFDVLTSTMIEGPRLDIYRSANHQTGLFAGDIKKAVAKDIEGAMRLFSESFAPYPWPALAATEIPGIHGQGFPQLLHLAWYSFETSREGITDAFRAHEVAHQWFGHMVGWATYHDQWLSEGFAEYSGAMYVQARNPGNKVFLELVKQWRHRILDVGGYGAWHDGPDVAPIGLGVRCASEMSPASYSHLVYSKGAYVLHMLRNMLYDYQNGSDARFLALMRDYVSSNAYRDASTRDFQAVVERHTGQNMQWFFDQWIDGVEVPRYEYSWDRQQNGDGQWVVKGQIAQHDVDSTFRAYMPITLVFEDGRRTFVHEVTGARGVFLTPPLPGRPKNVIFNDYLTVLCREKVVRKP